MYIYTHTHTHTHTYTHTTHNTHTQRNPFHKSITSKGRSCPPGVKAADQWAPSLQNAGQPQTIPPSPLAPSGADSSPHALTTWPTTPSGGEQLPLAVKVAVVQWGVPLR